MPFPTDELCPQVTIRWGEHTVDLSGAVRGRISIRHGGQSEGPVMPPSQVVFDLADPDGLFVPENPMSPYWPHIDIAAQLRIDLPPGLVPDGDETLFVGEVTTWQPYWLDGVEDEARIAVAASGILERLSNGDTPLESAMRRHYMARIDQLAGYTPLEDGPGTSRAVNLVPGTHGPAYSTGPAPEFPNRLGYGQDDSMPGSAPTPLWPVRDYLAWSVGATLRPFGTVGNTAYVMEVAVRVPPGSGTTWLHEWRTAGGRYTYWAIRTNSSGVVQVQASDEADTPTTVTYTSTAPAIDDGLWRVIQVGVRSPAATTQQVQIQIGDHNDAFAAASTPVGSAERMRTRPVFNSPDDKDPIGAGHAACVILPSTSVAAMRQALSTPPPVDGHTGERATRRVERLCAAEQIPLRILWGGMALLDDQFTGRTVVDGWGGDWQLTGDPDAFAVDGGQATIWPTTATPARTAYIEDAVTDVQCRTQVGAVGLPGQGQAGVILRRVDNSHWYEAMVRLFDVGGGLVQVDLWVWKQTAAGGYELIGSANIDEIEFDSGLRWNLVAEVEGATLRARAWRDGTPEPDWILRVVDTDITGPGGYGCGVNLFDTPQEQMVFESFLAVEDTSIRMGPQQRSTLLGNLQQASEVDSGILGEDRTTVGLIYRPLHGLVNQDPVLELSCHPDASGGQISSQYTPSLDTRFVRNDRTVTRVGGSSAQAVQTSGPRSTQPPPDGVGRYPDSTPLNAASDTQLPGLASWLLHLGVQQGMRIPTLPVDLAASPELIAPWMRAQVGDRLDLVGLPRQQHAPVRAVLQGWTAQLDAVDWRVSAYASPYDPYEIGVVAAAAGDQDVRGQAVDTDHSTLAQPGLWSPGATGAYASTPDDPSLDITGDLDLRVEATGNWGPGADIRVLVAKFDTDINPGNGSWYVSLNAAGELRLTWSTTGSNFITRVATALPASRAVGGRLAVRATLDVDNGSSGHTVTFHTAASLDGPWTQLGSPVTQAGTVVTFSGDAPLEAGSRSQGTIQHWPGTIHRLQVRDGIAGAVVADPDFAAEPPGTTVFTDAQGREWTVHGDAEIIGAVTDSQTLLRVETNTDHPLRGVWTTDPDDWDTSSTLTRGVIVAWTGSEASIPAGWRRVRELDGRYPKGIPNLTNAPGVQGGSLSHSHGTPGHRHSTNHAHGTPSTGAATNTTKLNSPSGGSDGFTQTHTHSWPTTGTTSMLSGSTGPGTDHVTNDPAHVEVIWIEARETATGIPDTAVALFAAATLPTSWARVYENRFLKGASANVDGGGLFAGSTNHSHQVAAHTHHGSSHGHTSAASGNATPTRDLTGGTIGVFNVNSHNHPIAIGSATSAPLHSAAGGTSGTTAAVLPPHTRVSAIRNNTGSPAVVPAGTIAAWMGSADELPEGWVVCDGTNNTPDLMGRYPHAASSSGQHGDQGGSLAGHTHTGGSHTHGTSSHSHSATVGQFEPSGFVLLTGRQSGSTNIATQTHRHSIGSTNQTTPTVGASSTGTLAASATEPVHTTVVWIMAVDAGADLTLDVEGPPRNGGPLTISVAGEHMHITHIDGDHSPQTFTVVRAVNGVQKPHQPGTAVNVAYPARIGL